MGIEVPNATQVQEWFRDESQQIWGRSESMEMSTFNGYCRTSATTDWTRIDDRVQTLAYGPGILLLTGTLTIWIDPHRAGQDAAIQAAICGTIAAVRAAIPPSTAVVQYVCDFPLPKNEASIEVVPCRVCAVATEAN